MLLFKRKKRYELAFNWNHKSTNQLYFQAAIAQLGERQTEDLKVPGSIPGRGTLLATDEIAKNVATA